ncbi:uncharacterized protein Z520_04379 [Fonsecaea multimorphosa CBS 102226]|uniref:Uncharacterized protein n=1 Tax=Fonsecaea multimorphosa CBS 102226 TaxID=1442371 RepID=A0A0D2KSN0_9EURO|nr:uncharacterized protein Z520_04379 [Fonsecaea multimorphosa CBS 102226]KIX99743.1 hypothetical protein Z520_04379 [Fonsecaea multimorphosa CBS 102226]OAL26533.1 hypothetical protein AYO22_04144 [Fonsecaea multimorphosa]
MTVEDNTGSMLSTLTTALQSAAAAFPEAEQQLLPPAEGISLLDIKNDLLLSYIQNLAFLVIIKLRNGYTEDSSADLVSEVTKHLVELRVYLERGVRPLESKLKYQIDKVVRAAEEADRRTAQRTAAGQVSKNPSIKKTSNRDGSVSDEFESGSEESSEDDAVENNHTEGDMSVGPRPAALLRNMDTRKKDEQTVKSRSTATGAYKPPRITPTAMPEPASQRDRDAPVRKRKSQLLDEYIDEELSTAPRAQPSIGSNNTILKHGRGAMSSKERDKERARIDYEERNFVRLPAESKAERRKARQRGEMDKRDLFGGEDWTGLGGLGDRIHRSVAGRARGEGSNVLERREKRRRDTQDGPRGDGSGGVGIGDSFEKRRRIMQQRADKKARRKG